MKKIIGVLVIAFFVLASVQLAQAQQTGKVYRIGYLSGRLGSSHTDPQRVAFRQRLRELGYVEGQNLVIEFHAAEGKLERLPGLAAELVRLKVDVIVTGANPIAIRAAQQATRTIPVVMTGVMVDPVAAGFAESLARPGGNITGLTNLEVVLHPKRLELLKEAFPGISRVAILWPEHQQRHAMKEIELAAQALEIQIQSLVGTGGNRLDELERFLFAISQENPDAVLVASSALTVDHRARVIDFTAKRRLPTIYGRNLFVNAGGLMSYGPDRIDMHRRVAIYVDKILKGAKPADLPVEQPMKFNFAINLKTAKKLGITIPPTLLYRATKVIK